MVHPCASLKQFVQVIDASIAGSRQGQDVPVADWTIPICSGNVTSINWTDWILSVVSSGFRLTRCMPNYTSSHKQGATPLHYNLLLELYLCIALS
jgi:hypothetical protein